MGSDIALHGRDAANAVPASGWFRSHGQQGAWTEVGDRTGRE